MTYLSRFRYNNNNDNYPTIIRADERLFDFIANIGVTIVIAFVVTIFIVIDVVISIAIGVEIVNHTGKYCSYCSIYIWKLLNIWKKSGEYLKNICKLVHA